MPADATTEPSRLALLERKLARVRILALLAFLVGAGGLAWGLFEQGSAVRDGQLWLARDDAGRIRGMFGVSADGVGLTLYDSTGQMRLDLGVAPGGVPGLLMLSAKGEPVATLNLIEGRVPLIRLTNVAESTRVLVQPKAGGAGLEVQAPRRPDTMIARSPRQ
jgi:hypothetical protein